MRALALTVIVALSAAGAPAFAAELPIFDAHVHYSHDAWENLPPKDAIGQMNIKRHVQLYKARGITVEVLSDPDEAMRWLESR